MEQKHDFRPYDDAKAMAGDPVGCRKEYYEAKVFIRDGSRIIGACRKKAAQYGPMASGWSAREWARNGHLRFETLNHPLDLVMLPLCYIQDKPAYPGDTLYDANGEAFQLDEALSKQVEAAKEWTWEKPVLGIETKMTYSELTDAYNAEPGNFAEDKAMALANAVLARAIADGQVVPTSAFFGVPGTALMLYGTPEAAKAACDYFLTCEPADRQNRASDITMDMGMHGTIKGNRAAIDHVRLLASLPERVACHVQSEASMLMLNATTSMHREDAAKLIRQMDIQGIIRKAKGE